MARIICLGDSNTYGYDPRSFLGGRYDEPWPELLAVQTGNIVFNFGQNGREIPTADWEMEGLDRQIGTLLPADLLIIMLGGNDILNLYHPTTEKVTARMEEYLRHLQEALPGLELLLIAPAPLDIPELDFVDLSRELGPCYEEMAEQLGVRFADAGRWNLPLAWDGIHFTQEGHRIFAETVANILTEIACKPDEF